MSEYLPSPEESVSPGCCGVPCASLPREVTRRRRRASHCTCFARVHKIKSFSLKYANACAAHLRKPRRQRWLGRAWCTPEVRCSTRSTQRRTPRAASSFLGTVSDRTGPAALLRKSAAPGLWCAWGVSLRTHAVLCARLPSDARTDFRIAYRHVLFVAGVQHRLPESRLSAAAGRAHWQRTDL